MLRRACDAVIVLSLVAVTVYVASLVIKVNTGYSRTVDTPDRIVRLQIVNGSGNNRLVGQIMSHTEDWSDLEMAVEVVETEEFDRSEIVHTFVISRLEDLSDSRLLAERIGLDPDEVIFKSLEHNSKQIAATLVLGTDAEECLLKSKSEQID
ncbi:MAG: hypothetical protein DRP45_00485 [Candidatus Zixiibacteriota bacterium]|nr:MAG: hypothetical protein DRP45_00485 [candidate division Zixibacteria bacterium]